MYNKHNGEERPISISSYTTVQNVTRNMMEPTCKQACITAGPRI